MPALPFHDPFTRTDTTGLGSDWEQRRNFGLAYTTPPDGFSTIGTAAQLNAQVNPGTFGDDATFMAAPTGVVVGDTEWYMETTLWLDRSPGLALTGNLYAGLYVKGGTGDVGDTYYDAWGNYYQIASAIYADLYTNGTAVAVNLRRGSTVLEAVTLGSIPDSEANSVKIGLHFEPTTDKQGDVTMYVNGSPTATYAVTMGTNANNNRVRPTMYGRNMSSNDTYRVYYDYFWLVEAGPTPVPTATPRPRLRGGQVIYGELRGGQRWN